MLKCGNCYYLAPSQQHWEHWPYGQCIHPETKKNYPVGFSRHKDDDCDYGYCDIWAARGAAQLCKIDQPSIFVSGDYLYVSVNGNIQSMTKIV